MKETENTAAQVKIGILGAGGRMGQMIAREILLKKHPGAVLAAAVDGPESPSLGKDVGEMLGFSTANIVIGSNAMAAFTVCDVLIDFTAPKATVEHTALAHDTGKALVIGTTGLDPRGAAAIEAAARRAPLLQSANMSIGVNLLISLVAQTAQKLGEEYDIEIFEAHHKHKIDAPSGTALALGTAAATGRGVPLEKAMVPARFGEVGARIPGSIGISVFRGGDVIGDHTVTFAGDGERIELSHKASDRSLFARGAVTAALWLAGKPPGRYTMQDVLSL